MAVKFGAKTKTMCLFKTKITKKLQEKAMWLINFETNPNVVGQLLKDSNILKLTDFIKYKYALFSL